MRPFKVSSMKVIAFFPEFPDFEFSGMHEAGPSSALDSSATDGAQTMHHPPVNTNRVTHASQRHARPNTASTASAAPSKAPALSLDPDQIDDVIEINRTQNRSRGDPPSLNLDSERSILPSAHMARDNPSLASQATASKRKNGAGGTNPANKRRRLL
ncbi:hypothetical protein OCU04_008429 [Sclerotinia nivalis]|uniref:Uncharacterized protein n=1 Tax=Sclerotinia nivalis TaxID=352851 RepID=A0A9X0AI25_9HELO|nr:hypothetical protein OCU04_008429 [Sclerotinia nivalis]